MTDGAMGRWASATTDGAMGGGQVQTSGPKLSQPQLTLSRAILHVHVASRLLMLCCPSRVRLLLKAILANR